MEDWSPVNENYAVSTLGRVNSTKMGRLLKLSLRKDGYLGVAFGRKGLWRPGTYLVHRIVAAAFIPNPENKPCINHKDGNKENNRIENLEWVTYAENEIHSRRVLGKKPSPNCWKKGEKHKRKGNNYG